MEIPSGVLLRGVVILFTRPSDREIRTGHRPNADLRRTDDAFTMTSTVLRGIRRRPGIIDRIVVMTISWMSALIIYDGWDILRFVDVAAIILGPDCSDLRRARLRRHPHRACQTRARPHQAGKGCPDRWLVPVPVARSAAACAASGAGCSGRLLHARHQVIIGAGTASLGFWGGLAGHRAGLTRLRLVLCVAGGLGLGALTLLLAAILQPGTKPFAP